MVTTEQKKRDKTIEILLAAAILTAFSSALIINIGSSTINPTQVILTLLFPALIIYNALRRDSVVVLYKDKVSLLIYLYAFSNLFSSLLFSDTKIQSLKGSLVIISYVMIFIAVRWALKFSHAPRNVDRLLKFNYYSASFGILCMILSFLTHSENFGVTFGHLAQSGMKELESTLPSIRSLSIEPNLFAVITAVLFCINLSVYLLWRKSSRQLWTLTILLIAIVFSYTRSVYVSVALALILIIILGNKLKLLFSMFRVALVALVLGVVILISLPKDSPIKVALAGRITTLFDFQKGSGLGRAHGYSIGIDGFKKNPLFGLGTLSADTRFYNQFRKVHQEYFGSPGWLNGAFIQALHDTGLIGLFIVAAIYGVLIVQNYNLYKRLDHTVIEKSVLLGFLVGNIVLLITAQLSSTLWISFPYIYWAINLAYISHVKTSPSAERVNVT